MFLISSSKLWAAETRVCWIIQHRHSLSVPWSSWERRWFVLTYNLKVNGHCCPLKGVFLARPRCQLSEELCKLIFCSIVLENWRFNVFKMDKFSPSHLPMWWKHCICKMIFVQTNLFVFFSNLNSVLSPWRFQSRWTVFAFPVTKKLRSRREGERSHLLPDAISCLSVA